MNKELNRKLIDVVDHHKKCPSLEPLTGFLPCMKLQCIQFLIASLSTFISFFIFISLGSATIVADSIYEFVLRSRVGQ